MTNYELFGPWTGNALHAPALPPRIAHRLARRWGDAADSLKSAANYRKWALVAIEERHSA